jgi:hypothetical protein
MTIMYLIQRKSDGKFFKNKDHSGWLRDEYSDNQDPHWTANKEECKPFKNIGGAKASRGWVDKKLIRDSTKECKVCIKNTTGHWDHWKWVKRTEEELPYRIVPVTVTMSIK